LSSDVRDGLRFGGRSGGGLLCAGMWGDGCGEFDHSGTLRVKKAVLGCLASKGPQ